MANLRFEWDEAKNLANRRKHGIRFEDAVEAFYDPLNISKREHDKDGEWRWQTFGVVSGFDLMMVAHTVAEESVEGVLIEVVGIISARYADRHERRQYEDENG